MEKIAILTFHRPLNYGAVLQAVATYRMLEKSNYQPLLIDYRHPRIEKSRQLFDLEKEYPPYKNLKNLVKGVLRFETEKIRGKRFDEFIRNNTLLSKPCEQDEQLRDATKNIDILLVGSDLVWNCDIDKDLNKVFFLTFDDGTNKLKCSYASSLGTSIIPQEYEERYKNYLSSFTHISVREKTAKILLERITEKQISVVLDPTLMIDKSEWEQLEKYVKVPDKYIVCYILEFTPEVIEVIKRVEDYFQLPVVYFTRDTVYGKRGVSKYKYGPAEFLYILHHAEFVLTNSFHGTVFSILYRRDFATIPHSTRGSRMKDLLSEFGMSDRLIKNGFDFEILRKNRLKTNFSDFDNKLEKLKAKSMEYIVSLRG